MKENSSVRPAVNHPIRVHRAAGITKSGITPSPEFAKKGLASFAINVGAKCGHDCTYCSTGVTLRLRKVFKNVGESPFERGYAIVDDTAATRVMADAQKLGPCRHKLAQLCTLTDAWAPETLPNKLGRQCLEAVLKESDCQVRILTKNAAVEEEFDVIQKYRDRVLVGLSLTGTEDKENVLACTEPNASPIRERMRVLQKAHQLGFRTFGMLCPLLPSISDAPEQIERLVKFVQSCGAEEIFCEPVNPRGKGLIFTQEALLEEGFEEESEAVGQIRKRAAWSHYAVNLLENIQKAVITHGCSEKLRFLMYPSKLLKPHLQWVKTHAMGVKQLGSPKAWI